MNKEDFEKYFEKYLLNIRGVSDSTVKHYFGAIKKISSLLPSLEIYDVDSIYEVDSLSYLNTIKQKLKEDKYFRDLDKRGNQMYSAGFNGYINFTEGKGFNLKDNPLALIDTPCSIKAPLILKERTAAARDRIIVYQVFKATDFHCEINSEHDSFISEKYHKMYVEGHHIIPISMQSEFDKSIDVYANLMALCPICHRQLHYGLPSDKKRILTNIYEQRADRYKDSGFSFGEKEFLEIVEEGNHKSTVLYYE